MNWHVEGRGDEFDIVDDQDVTVATVPYTAETGDEPLDTAEGRRAVLLSAAPEMLAALDGWVQWLDAPMEQGITDAVRKMHETAQLTRAAISKAKGGPQ